MRKRKMGTFTVDAEFSSLRARRLLVSVPRMLVDSGSEFTWIPEELLRSAGVRPVKAFEGLLPNGRTISRAIGFAIVRAASFETIDEVVFAQPGDLVRLGARTLSGFGARVDVRRKRLVVSGPHPAASMSLVG